MDDGRRHAPPSDCPVCGRRLLLTRLGCDDCGTELSGAFQPCAFCALGAEDRDLLRVFLASRGNMKDLERHLGVSYPTARARFDAVLNRLGIEPARSAEADPPPEAEPAGADAPAPAPDLAVLEALSAGTIDVDEALRHLG